MGPTETKLKKGVSKVWSPENVPHLLLVYICRIVTKIR